GCGKRLRHAGPERAACAEYDHRPARNSVLHCAAPYRWLTDLRVGSRYTRARTIIALRAPARVARPASVAAETDRRRGRAARKPSPPARRPAPLPGNPRD